MDLKLNNVLSFLGFPSWFKNDKGKNKLIEKVYYPLSPILSKQHCFPLKVKDSIIRHIPKTGSWDNSVKQIN